MSGEKSAFKCTQACVHGGDSDGSERGFVVHAGCGNSKHPFHSMRCSPNHMQLAVSVTDCVFPSPSPVPPGPAARCVWADAGVTPPGPFGAPTSPIVTCTLGPCQGRSSCTSAATVCSSLQPGRWVQGSRCEVLCRCVCALPLPHTPSYPLSTFHFPVFPFLFFLFFPFPLSVHFWSLPRWLCAHTTHHHHSHLPVATPPPLLLS